MSLPPPAEAGVLVELDRPLPVPWSGSILRAHEVGLLCTRRPDCLVVWAPGEGGWARACRLLAMVRTAAPENCVVLTDVVPELDGVPSDVWIAAVGDHRAEAARRGTAAYACADVRSDWIFRQLLAGRVRRHPELLPLLGLHALSATPHGRRLLDRWADLFPVLFADGLDEMMPEALRADLEELARAARDAEYAVTGGFHSLDPEVRDAGDWEAGCRRYLPLSSRSPEARAVIQRWLAETAGWESSADAEALRVTAAAALHQLVDDPWLAAPLLAELLFTRFAA